MAALALIALVVAGCGGDKQARKSGLVWKDKPTLRVSPTGARVLIGTVKNASPRELRIKSSDVRAVDPDGGHIKTSAAFVSSFVRSVYPQNGRPGERRSEFPEAEQRRIGFLAVLGPGESAPLTVSWNEPRGPKAVAKIDTSHGSLPVP